METDDAGLRQRRAAATATTTAGTPSTGAPSAAPAAASAANSAPEPPASAAAPAADTRAARNDPQQQQQQQQQRQQQLHVVSGAVAAAGACLSAGAIAALLVSESDRVLPLLAAMCVAVFTSVLFRVALGAVAPARINARDRFRRATRHLTGERAAYVRTSQRLAMLDRDFTAADYEMLLDLDNNSQRLRHFLEGASRETIERLPTYSYKKPTRGGERAAAKVECSRDAASRDVDGAEVVEEDCARDDDVESTNSTLVQSTSSLLAAPQGEAADGGEDVGETSACCDIVKPVIESVVEEARPAPTEPGGETATTCTICLEQFEDGMTIRILPCMHQFMAECIDPWLLQQAKCPVCKQHVFANL